MAALTANYEMVNLSFTFDALTLYPTFEYYQRPNLRNCLEAAIGECNQLGFVIKLLSNEVPTKENLGFIDSLHLLMKQEEPSKVTYDRFIRRDDDDHDLYHKDKFKLNDSHWHIKFKNFLSAEQLEEVLAIFVKHEILRIDEKEDFISLLNKRHLDARSNLYAKFITEDRFNTNAIITFIRETDDNDILRNLHQYLLSDTFDCLRADDITNKNYHCQGTDKGGCVVPTSKCWAEIEKAISLQLAHNIKTSCSKFTPSLGHERAGQLADALSFFAIKRKTNSLSDPNKIFDALDKGDSDSLDKKHSAFFAKPV